MRAARRKLKVPMPAAMPCKIPIKSSWETHLNVGKRKTEYACVVDADGSTRPRLEGAGHKRHQGRITAKGMNYRTHHCLIHKFIMMPQALKIPDAKAAVEKEWENWRRYRHDSWRKSETRKKWSLKQGLRATQFTLRHQRISVILRIRSWSFNIKSTKAGSYSEVTLWKMILVRMQCSLSKDHQHLKW